MDGIGKMIEQAAAAGENMAGIVEAARQFATAVESRFKRDAAAQPIYLLLTEAVATAAELTATPTAEPVAAADKVTDAK